MGIEDPKIRLLVLILINVALLLALRYWTMHGSAFFWLRQGLSSS